MPGDFVYSSLSEPFPEDVDNRVPNEVVLRVWTAGTECQYTDPVRVPRRKETFL